MSSGSKTSLWLKERAACNLADSGMFEKEQRMLAVPELPVPFSDRSAEVKQRAGSGRDAAALAVLGEHLSGILRPHKNRRN